MTEEQKRAIEVVVDRHIGEMEGEIIFNLDIINDIKTVEVRTAIGEAVRTSLMRRRILQPKPIESDEEMATGFHVATRNMTADEFEKFLCGFIASVRADERELAAKVCEEIESQYFSTNASNLEPAIKAAGECAEAIRKGKLR